MTHLADRLAFPVSAIRAAEAPLISAERGTSASGSPASADRLMRRAAWGVADVARTVLRAQEFLDDAGGRVYGHIACALVGAGDNGGDALYALAELARSGLQVHAVLLAPDRVHSRALAAARRRGARVHSPGDEAEIESLLSRLDPDIAIDGIVGLGASGPPRPLAGHAAGVLAALGTPIVSVDVPSGIDPDTGLVHPGAIRPTATVTFGLWRRAHLLASTDCGALELVDIGIQQPGAGSGGAGAGKRSGANATADPDAGLDPDSSRDNDGADAGSDASSNAGALASLGTRSAGELWPVPGESDNKYSGGVVAVRAGSDRYPGAAVLSSHAAVHATSAMVRYVGPCRREVLAERPEIVASSVVTNTGRSQAWVAGPGMGVGAESAQELEWILSRDLPTVLDADALRVLAEHPSVLRRRTAPLVLTPHAGEFDALAQTFAPEVAGTLAGDRAGAVRALARAFAGRGVDSATVLLKGRITIIDDGRTAYAQDAGSSWAATPGSGDVLSGIVGAVLAAQASSTGALGAVGVPHAVAMAQVVHSVAARLAAEEYGRPGAPIGASDLLAAVPEAIARVREVAE
ncbi:bifunctional ADP-dependent NAD(P)H-hydrate dehydratase/NAD(P)H-hydrate epimerase [Dietzia sp.]|uniref:bifunctional ADP-dependent NAD(P)H-hydrate dehydratase/NAD(P)H-hydrate epimerase n=1 Tax=Dietzia sp. TaxID=1871616 RepID=UPI002FD91F6E